MGAVKHERGYSKHFSFSVFLQKEPL